MMLAMSKSTPSGFRHVLGDRVLRVFLTVTFVDAAGRGLFLAGSALFYTQVIGLTVTQVGLGLSVAGLCGLLCAVPIGKAADRFGDGRVLIILQVWRAGCFICYPLVSDMTMFVVLACMVGAADWAMGSLIQSIAGTLVTSGSRVETMATVTVVRNVGYALVALLATVFIGVADTSWYIAFVLGNAAALLISALLFASLRLPRRPPAAPAERRRPLLTDPTFLSLSVANGILYLHAALLSVGVPLWIVTQTEAPKALVGGVLAVNTVLAVTLQKRLSRGGDDVLKAARKQMFAALALTACCVTAAWSGEVGPVVAVLLLTAAVALLTLGEVWQSAGAWGLSYGLAPEHGRTAYLATYGLGMIGVSIVGPLVLSVVVETGAAGWLALAAVFVATGLGVPVLARRAVRHAPDPDPAPDPVPVVSRPAD